MNFGEYLKKIIGTGSLRLAAQKAIETFRNLIRNLYSRDTTPGVGGKPPPIKITNMKPEYLGSMVSFSYNPKWKEKLPYYDTFPLVIPINIYDDGFLGLNLHYLPPMLRSQLLDEAYKEVHEKINSRKKPNEYYTREELFALFRFAQSIEKNLMRNNYYKPCMKRYLTTHLTSQIMIIPPEEWGFTLLLPTERFVKKSKEFVWEESKMKIRGG